MSLLLLSTLKLLYSSRFSKYYVYAVHLIFLSDTFKCLYYVGNHLVRHYIKMERVN